VYHFRTDFRPDDPRYAVSVIVPALAQAFLDRHAGAGGPLRAASDPVVRAYASAVERGDWRLNGDTVIIGSDGRILDGVARLQAVVRAGRDIHGIVVSGVDPKVYETINTQLKRRTTDILSINGERFPAVLANAWTVILGYLTASDRSRYVARNYQVGLTQVEVLTDRHPGLRQSVDATHPLAGVSSHGTLAALHFLFAKVDARGADAFFADLCKPEPEAPLLQTLRRKLHAMRARGHRIPRTYLAAIVIKAWERHRRGGTLSMAGLDFGGETETSQGLESFPVITDLPGVDVSDEAAAPPAPLAPPDESVRIVPILLDEDTARHLLENNGPVGSERNRTVRKLHVARIARDIREGRWGFNGQTIKVSRHGRLIDGQHRCLAVLEAGTSVRTYVVLGVEDDVFTTYDSGRRRSFSKLIKSKGAANDLLHAGAVSALFAMRNPKAHASHGELMGIYEAETGLDEAVTFVMRWSDQSAMLKLEGSACAALLHMFRKRDRGMADAFFVGLMEGADLPRGSPVHVLRERLLRHARARVGEPARTYKMRLVIHAWNLARRGAPVPGNGLQAGSGPLPAIL